MLAARLTEIITCRDLDRKIALGLGLKNAEGMPIAPAKEGVLAAFRQPGRPDGFAVIAPRAVPKRDLRDPQGRANFLHAIANIELLAIELPALCLLRFGSEDSGFVARQFAIIAEEAAHFQALRKRLRELGCEFGTRPVHHGLWEHAWRCRSELEHQIIIPCYLEARGLDVTPGFVRDFQALNDPKSAAVLQIILNDEIGHVRQGLAYLQEQAQKRGATADELYEEVLRGYFGARTKSPVVLNRDNRRRAGFSERQIDFISS